MKENLKLFQNICQQYKKSIYIKFILIFHFIGFYMVNFRSDITSNYNVEYLFNSEILDFLLSLISQYDQLSQFIILVTLILDILLIIFLLTYLIIRKVPFSFIMILYGITLRFYYNLYNKIYIEAYTIFKNKFIKISKKLDKNDYFDIFNSIMEKKFKYMQINVDFYKVLPEIKGLNDYNLVVEKITYFILNNAVIVSDKSMWNNLSLYDLLTSDILLDVFGIMVGLFLADVILTGIFGSAWPDGDS